MPTAEEDEGESLPDPRTPTHVSWGLYRAGVARSGACPPSPVRCEPDHGGARGIVMEFRAVSRSVPLTGERGSRGPDPEAAQAAGPAALPHHAGAGKQLCRAGGRRVRRAGCCRAGGGEGGLCRPSPPSFSLPPPGVPRAQQPGALPQRLPQRAVVGIRYGPAPRQRRTLRHCWSCSGAQLCASPGLCTCQSCCGGGRTGGARAQSHSTASRSRSRLRGFFQDPTQESASQQRRK